MASLRLRRKDSTPARQVTGTSYSSPTAPNISAPTLTEIGSAAASKVIDPVPDVGTDYQATRTYTKMVRDDASVRTSLRAGKAPVLGAEFFIDPYDNTPENLAIWEFVHFNLFQGMTSPWSIVLEQILSMYESSKGNSIFELVWENREWAPKKSTPTANRKVYTMLRKMAYRPSATIKEIEYDKNGGPVNIIQNAIDEKGNTSEEKIPISKSVIFVLNQEGASSLEGLPILRSAYKHWFYKDRLYAIDAIQKERHGIGIPDIEIQPGAGEKDIQMAHEMGKNLRTNEFSYIVRPPTIKVGFAEIRGNLVDALVSAQHHDIMIMKNIMVQFLNLGESGGRNTSATAMDMFLKSMRHIANGICDAYNLYVIPNLVAYNFPTDQFPQLKVRNVGEVKDLQMWAAAMRNLIDVGAITVDEQTEAWIRDQLDMPKLQTPWVPLEQRPARITEQMLLNKTPKVASVNPSRNGNTSPNGGAGNVGKSASSGAV
jgi:hypothetical protein